MTQPKERSTDTRARAEELERARIQQKLVDEARRTYMVTGALVVLISLGVLLALILAWS